MPPRSSLAPSPAAPAGLHVSLLAVPDAALSTLAGIYDVMNARAISGLPAGAASKPFRVDIVGESVGPLDLASGVPIPVQRSIDSIEASDIVIVPSLLVSGAGWQSGRYPRLVAWLLRMHERGAL
eukprot:Opistho-2@92603